MKKSQPAAEKIFSLCALCAFAVKNKMISLTILIDHRKIAGITDFHRPGHDDAVILFQFNFNRSGRHDDGHAFFVRQTSAMRGTHGDTGTGSASGGHCPRSFPNG